MSSSTRQRIRETEEEEDVHATNSSSSAVSTEQTSSSEKRDQTQKQDSHTEDEDEDELVASYDVYISQELSDRLYLLQHRWRKTGTSGHFPVQEARFRPNNAVLELEHGLDTNSPHYDPESHDRKRVQTIRTVSQAVPSQACYLVGVKRDDGIHLTPLHGMFDMKADFSHMANAELPEWKKSKGATTEEENLEQEPQRLTTKIKRQETERAMTARKRSYRYTQQLVEQEPPIDLDVYNRYSAECKEAQEELYVTGEKAAQDCYPDHTAGSYLRVWKPPRKIHQPQEQEAKRKDDLDLSTLRGQVERIMRKGVCLPFEKIKEFVTNYEDEGEIVVELHKIATLVRGNWCLKSSQWVKHVSPTFSAKAEGFPAPCNASTAVAVRDFVICQFRKFRAISRPWIARVTSIDRSLLKEILDGIARLNPPLRQWELRHPDDAEFLQRYSGVAAAMDTAWEKRERELRQTFSSEGGTREDWTREHYAAPPEVEALRAQRDRIYEQLRQSFENAPQEDDEDWSEDEQEGFHQLPRRASKTMVLNSDDINAAKEILRKEFLNHGVCNIRYLAKCLRKSVASATNTSGLLSAVRFLEDSTLFLVVQKILLGQNEPITKSENSDLRLEETDDSSPLAVCVREGPPPDDEHELEEKSSARRSSVGSVGDDAYVLWERSNETLDPFRKVVIDLFRAGNSMLKRADVTKAVKDALNEDIPPNVYNKVMRELALSKRAHCWVLKSGDPSAE
eukprot:gb/GECG01010010.1/.p1 GENE.gb/GECG01010010.1/~~gb/GECG01010010.1/.p1  ORF type:complete len:736 (+),score=133.18 gb/GECG01010010.1/:1-2208(+)